MGALFWFSWFDVVSALVGLGFGYYVFVGLWCLFWNSVPVMVVGGVVCCVAYGGFLFIYIL